MSHKKAGGSSRNGRDSQGQRLGPKRFSGETVTGGSILVRQRGNKFWAGDNVGEGRDCTLYSRIDGIVHYQQRGRRGRRYIDVLPIEAAVAN